MKILILARNPRLYSHRRLVEAGQKRGHEMRIVNTLRCYMNITSHRPEVRYEGKVLEGYDAVIPRIGASVTFYGLAVLRQFEMMGVYPLNESVAIGRSRDKLRSLQLLAREGVGMPVTAFANESTRTDDVIEMVGGAPVVIKLLEGTQGIGVVLGANVFQIAALLPLILPVVLGRATPEAFAQVGGTAVLYLLIVLSVLSIGVILERWLWFRRRRVDAFAASEPRRRQLRDRDRAGGRGAGPGGHQPAAARPGHGRSDCRGERAQRRDRRSADRARLRRVGRTPDGSGPGRGLGPLARRSRVRSAGG